MSVFGLLRLASPALPIGAFAWSGGLEAAVDAGIVSDTDSARIWLQDGLELMLARWDLPILWRMCEALASEEHAVIEGLNCMFLASRDTAELRAETLQTGAALLRLVGCRHWTLMGEAWRCRPTLPASWAVAAREFGIMPRDAIAAFAFSWVENQTAVLTKTVPLGQQAVQGLIHALSTHGGPLDAAVASAMKVSDEEMVPSLPGLGRLSATHESQYSRLFRS